MEKNSTTSAIGEAATKLALPDNTEGARGHEHLSNLDVALGYAERGIAVRPSGMADQDPTTDPAVIRGWWDVEDDDVSVVMKDLVAVQIFKDGLSTLHLWEGSHGVLPETHALVDDNLDYPTIKLLYSVEGPVEGFCESSVPIRVWGTGEAVAVTGGDLAAVAPIDSVPIVPADDGVMSFIGFLRGRASAGARDVDEPQRGCLARYPRQYGTTVDIDRVVVADRIRRDYGDLTELAEDIRSNTLLNPPVVTANDDGTYTLIAGERRLRAMRDILGYRQTEVNVVTPRDAEHALSMEISENECRKDFSMTERLSYAHRLSVIESAKARERMEAGKAIDPRQEIGKGRSADAVAATLGTNRETLRQAQFIADNRGMISVAEFESWDEGELSTNQVFKKIKAAQKQAEEERHKANEAKRQAERDRAMMEKERDAAKQNLADAYRRNEILENENARLRNQPKPQPEVIEREVVPDDYEQLKRRVPGLESENKRLVSENSVLRESNIRLNREVEQRDELLGERERNSNAQRDIEVLTAATNAYLRKYGGKAWVLDQLDRVDERAVTEFRKALSSIDAFAQNLILTIDEYGGRLASGIGA